MLVDCKFCSVACIFSYGYCTRILYVSIAPLYEVVMFGWSCRNLDFRVVVVRSVASCCAHCFVVGVNSNGELVDCKDCRVCYISVGGYRAWIVGVSVIPLYEVVVFGWSCRNSDFGSCIKHSATRCGSECTVVCCHIDSVDYIYFHIVDEE